jgi:hypothetical protein
MCVCLLLCLCLQRIHFDYKDISVGTGNLQVLEHAVDELARRYSMEWQVRDTKRCFSLPWQLWRRQQSGGACSNDVLVPGSMDCKSTSPFPLLLHQREVQTCILSVYCARKRMALLTWPASPQAQHSVLVLFAAGVLPPQA